MTLSLRDIVKQGYLSKGHEIWTNYWEKRWIIIKKGWLYNLKAPKDKKGEVLCLKGAAVCPSKRKKPFSFTVRIANNIEQSTDNGSSNSNGNNNNNVSYTELSFAATTEEEMKTWTEAFCKCVCP